MTAVLATAVFVVTYALIATERVHRVAAALGGAAAMVVIGVVDAESAFFDRETAIDWNVIFLLLGMMILVGVLRQTGVFEFLAIWSAKRARGRPFRIMASLVVLTALASALLDNVTTVLLVAPVTVLLCDRLDLDPVPFLIAEVFASNIGGTATLIGDPPNIIIASRSGLSFNDFLVNLAPFVLVLVGVLLVLCRLLFRKALTLHPDRVAEIMELDEREAIRDRTLLWQSLAVLGLTIVGFVLHTALHLEPSIVALLGAGLLVFVSRVRIETALREVEWPTLVFFMGLFVVVGGLISAGVIDRLARRGRRGHRRRPPPRLHAAARGVGGAVRHRGQHPVRGDDEPGRGRAGRERAARRRRPERALVGAGPRRRPGRQRDRGRRQRQRGGARHRRAQRAPDLVLAVHPVRAGGRRRRRSCSRRRTCGCATSSWAG